MTFRERTLRDVVGRLRHTSQWATFSEHGTVLAPGQASFVTLVSRDVPLIALTLAPSPDDQRVEVYWAHKSHPLDDLLVVDSISSRNASALARVVDAQMDRQWSLSFVTTRRHGRLLGWMLDADPPASAGPGTEPRRVLHRKTALGLIVAVGSDRIDRAARVTHTASFRNGFRLPDDLASTLPPD